MIIGHQKQLQYLKKILESKKIPHAFLFSGPAKIGKKTVALDFASKILENPLKNHPDFILIEPISKQIKIEQIRELSWFLSLKPSLAAKKVAIIDSAHLMTKEAQNSFLKTLEEAKNSVLILISEFPKILLPTIISRCQIIKFFPPKKSEIEGYLKKEGLPKEKIEKILEICGRKIGEMIELAKDPKQLKEIEKLEKEIESLKNSPIFLKFQWVKKSIKKYGLEKILEYLCSFFRKKFLFDFDKKRFKIL